MIAVGAGAIPRIVRGARDDSLGAQLIFGMGGRSVRPWSEGSL